MTDPTQPIPPTGRPVIEPADPTADQEPTVDDTTLIETALIETEPPAAGAAVEPGRTERTERTEPTQPTEPMEPSPTGGYQPPTTPPMAAMSGAGAAAGAPRRGVSVPTVLWGLILALVAALAILHQVSDVDINLAVGVPVVLLAVGGALVVWGVAGLARKSR